jgi:hypothetical protein
MVPADSGAYPIVGWSNSRYIANSGKAQRDIVVNFVRNISESSPEGLILATFRASDTSENSHNLTYIYHTLFC